MVRTSLRVIPNPLNHGEKHTNPPGRLRTPVPAATLHGRPPIPPNDIESEADLS